MERNSVQVTKLNQDRKANEETAVLLLPPRTASHSGSVAFKGISTQQESLIDAGKDHHTYVSCTKTGACELRSPIKVDSCADSGPQAFRDEVD
eukprot:5564435-Amphidinium_carterae.1